MTAAVKNNTATGLLLPVSRQSHHFNVNPRYTSGSPACLSCLPDPQGIAEEVARQEVRAYEMVLTGVQGEALQKQAQTEGVGPASGRTGDLESPAEYVEEHRGHWMIQCLCTGKLFVRPFHKDRKSLRPQNPCQRCLTADARISLAQREETPEEYRTRTFFYGEGKGR